jgi:hypothetical protein
LVAWLVLNAACQGDDWIIGGELPRDTGSAPEGARSPELVSDPGTCPSSLDLLDQHRQAYAPASVAPGHVGRWRGPLGSDAAAGERAPPGTAGFPSLELELQIDASGAGTLRFDAPPSDRLPYDSDEGYLCTEDASGVVCGSESGFVAGFSYSILAARSLDDVLTFSVATADPWARWCAEHEPVSWADPAQACGLAFGVLPQAQSVYSPMACARVSFEGAEEIDCTLMYALDYCECARDACFARVDRRADMALALSRDGTTLSGSLWYEDQTDAASIALGRVP